MTILANSAGRVAKYAAGQIPMTPDINGGTIDGAAIGGGTPATGAFTTLSASGVLTASSANNVIRIGTSCNLTTPPAIGGTTPAAGAFTTLSATGQITSTLASGTAPLVVASTTVVANLNVSLLLGATWAAPGTIGSGTPNTGAFTTIAASGQITSTVTTGTAPLVIASTTAVANLNASLLLGGTWAIPGSIGATTPAAGAFTTLSASGALAANADITTTQTTFNLVNATVTTLNIGGAATQTTIGASGSTLDIGSLLEFNGGGDNTIRAFGGRTLNIRLGSTAGANQLHIRDSGFNLVSSCTDVGAWTMTGLTVTGNSTFGDATTDTFTFVGRMIVRSVTDAGPMTATAGSQREVVFNTSDSKFYGCTVAGSPATWAAFH